jgi:deoxycytidylate deaminase
MESPLLRPVEKQKTDDESLQTRVTAELVIALAGPIGSGVSTTAEILKTFLMEEYNYTVDIVTVSDLIRESAHLVENPPRIRTTAEGRVSDLQRLGNLLRQKYSRDYLAQKCVERMHQKRERREDGIIVGEPRRHAHIIDSLKNPAEQELLHAVYGDLFWLVGVFGSEEIRKNRLQARGFDKQTLDGIIGRDEDEPVIHGQKVKDTLDDADFFVRNNSVNRDLLKDTIARFLSVVFNITITTPTRDEMAMHSAASAASRSACLSRQVGAAIYAKDGEQIGLGWNDVPKSHGGLYTSEDGAKDNRCYKWQQNYCHNDHRKGDMVTTIVTELKTLDFAKSASLEQLQQALQKTEIRNLTEFCRSVHAEMEAILSVARNGKKGLHGATMYVTTFPCHHCARHLIASGISRVVYIEPYPKSKALQLHSDSITVDEGKEDGRVLCLQYEGFAPKKIEKFFGNRNRLERKNADGTLMARSKKSAMPVFPPPLDSLPTREALVINDLHKLENQRV